MVGLAGKTVRRRLPGMRTDGTLRHEANGNMRTSLVRLPDLDKRDQIRITTHVVGWRAALRRRDEIVTGRPTLTSDRLSHSTTHPIRRIMISCKHLPM
jgi:hypothetical protein